MRRRVSFKLVVIAGLMLLLLIPLMLIDGVVDERKDLYGAVLQDIARSSSYSQKIAGPVLVIPYVKTWEQWEVSSKGERYLKKYETSDALYFLPERFTLNGEVTTESRKRGIYEALLYQSDNRIDGHFRVPAHFGIESGFERYRFGKPFLAVGISDIRGIRNDMQLEVNGQTVGFVPGTAVDFLKNGIHAPLPSLNGAAEQRLDFAFQLKLQGTSDLTVVPVGRDTQVTLRSSWPHPSFFGEYLPTTREVSAQGFSATWQSSFFSTNLEEALQACVTRQSCHAFENRLFGVSFIEPVDQYLKTERSIKYALLFIVLTFAAFFLFEVLGRLAIHPIQYTLVGMALALFYLLLVSLSEHMPFGFAYGISALSCVGLIGFYVMHVLRSRARGAVFGGLLAVLYGVLYLLLDSEDYALLIGSVLVFAALAAVMVLTRNLDWYDIGRPAVAMTETTEA